MDRLSEIRARAEAATPGPWQSSKSNYGVIMLFNGTGRALLGPPEGAGNAAFIAHSRGDIPYLLDRLEKAEAALSDMRFAYVNKDQDVPHAFEVDAMNTAAGILGEWPPKGE